jgi:hypothetical protein
MARDLSSHDIELLKKLAPECEDIICSGSGSHYRSILPPVANHFSSDETDFKRRLEELNDADLSYLIDLIRDGSESLGCIPPAFVKAFVLMVAERVDFDTANELILIYTEEGSCDDRA